MSKPKLFVIAGCNGSGKSSFANAITPNGLESFDYDKEFLSIYQSKRDSEMRTGFAHYETRNLLERSIDNAICKALDFCYETNFNSTPMFWPKQFKRAGFELILFFFCLDTIEKAKERVRIRFENGGHFVPDHEIEERFRLGYQNLNTFYAAFDYVHLLNSSTYKKAPTHFLSIQKNEIIYQSEFPTFLSPLIPEISNLNKRKSS